MLSKTLYIERLRKVVKDDKVSAWQSDLLLAEDELKMLNEMQKLIAMKSQTQENIDRLTAELEIEKKLLSQDSL